MLLDHVLHGGREGCLSIVVCSRSEMLPLGLVSGLQGGLQQQQGQQLVFCGLSRPLGIDQVAWS
jgi:hypothetical protein